MAAKRGHSGAHHHIHHHLPQYLSVLTAIVLGIIVIAGVKLVFTGGIGTVGKAEGVFGDMSGPPVGMPSGYASPLTYQSPDMIPPGGMGGAGGIPPDMGGMGGSAGMGPPTGSPPPTISSGVIACPEGEIFTTFYYDSKGSFVHTTSDGTELKVSEANVYKMCRGIKMREDPHGCPVGTEWQDSQWGWGCRTVDGGYADLSKTKYIGFDSAECCAPIEEPECPKVPSTENSDEMVQYVACNPDGKEYIELECCDTRPVSYFECENKKCVRKPAECDFGDGPQYVCGKRYTNDDINFDAYCTSDSITSSSNSLADYRPRGLYTIFRILPELNGCSQDQSCNCRQWIPAVECIGPNAILSKYEVGQIYVTYADGSDYSFTDRCYGQNSVFKYFCSDALNGVHSIDCGHSETCSNGRCIQMY